MTPPTSKKKVDKSHGTDTFNLNRYYRPAAVNLRGVFAWRLSYRRWIDTLRNRGRESINPDPVEPPAECSEMPSGDWVLFSRVMMCTTSGLHHPPLHYPLTRSSIA